MTMLQISKLSAGAAMLLGALLPAHAEQIVLKVHHMLPATSNPHLNVLHPWCDKINKESNDRLKCQIYPAMQLGGTPPQLYDQVRDGVVDIVWTVPTYSAGRFSKSEVFELPFMAHSAKAGSQALWQYVQKNALDEFKGTRLIFMHVHDGSVFHFTKQPVKNLEDLKGLKVRAATRINARMLQALGATPVQMPLPQVPEALSKGVIDGAMVPWEGVPAIKLQEIAKYHVETPPGAPRFSNTIFVMAMNPAKYDSLPPDLKAIVENACAACNVISEAWCQKNNAEAMEDLIKNQGVIAQPLPDSVVAALRAATEKILAEAVAKDPVTKKVHESYMGYMAKYKQWAHYSESVYHDKILGKG